MLLMVEVSIFLSRPQGGAARSEKASTDFMMARDRARWWDEIVSAGKATVNARRMIPGGDAAFVRKAGPVNSRGVKCRRRMQSHQTVGQWIRKHKREQGCP
jgi:hypothetical protein